LPRDAGKGGKKGGEGHGLGPHRGVVGESTFKGTTGSWKRRGTGDKGGRRVVNDWRKSGSPKNHSNGTRCDHRKSKPTPQGGRGNKTM